MKVEGEAAFLAATRTWTGTVVVPRQLVGEDRFVCGLEPAEDRDFWVRLIAKAPMLFISDPLATAALEPGSLSRSSVRRDCENMLRVVRRHKALLGRSGTRRWEADTYRRWAANLVGVEPQRAVVPAFERLCRTPLSTEAWWVLGKACLRSLTCAGVRRA